MALLPVKEVTRAPPSDDRSKNLNQGPSRLSWCGRMVGKPSRAMSDLQKILMTFMGVAVLGLGFGVSLNTKATQATLRKECNQSYTFSQVLILGSSLLASCRHRDISFY